MEEEKETLGTGRGKMGMAAPSSSELGGRWGVKRGVGLCCVVLCCVVEVEA